MEFPTPQSLFDAIEQATGRVLNDIEKTLTVLAVEMDAATPEEMYTIAIHDCPNCKIYDVCKKADKRPQDESVVKLSTALGLPIPTDFQIRQANKRRPATD